MRKLNETEKRIRKELIHQIRLLLEWSDKIEKEYKASYWTRASQINLSLFHLNLISAKNSTILDKIIEKKYFDR